MKKLIFALILISFFSCDNLPEKLRPPHKDTPREKAKRDLEIMGAFLLWQNQASIEPSACMDYTPNVPNPVYFTPDYYFRFVQYTGPALQNVIIGDSTMDISIRYAGWYDAARTLPYPVSGNRLCDMTVEFPAMRFYGSPSFVLVSTAGGNDILGLISNANIINSGKLLIDKIRSRWPTAKIVVVGIHPTQVSYANANKAATNAGIQAYLSGLSNTCFYNPLALFGVAEGQAAPANMMLDSIHYNQAMSFSIKAALATNCGISL